MTDFNGLLNLPTIIGVFKNHRFINLTDEKKLQLDIESQFKEIGLNHLRELHLNNTDIIDFMVDKIGIEVKIKGSVREIYRQLCRYAESDQIDMLILVTNRHIQLPKSINKKATHIINLGQAWL